MSNEQVVVKPARNWAKKLGRGLLYTFAALFVLGFVAKTIWKYSGSNQWRLVAENKKNSVKVYALKAPGTELEQVRAVGRIKTSLAGVVKFMQDADVCDRMGCSNSRVLEQSDERLWYTTFRFPYPRPFRPREFVVRGLFSQDPQTKELLLHYSAMPQLLPPSEGVYRVTRMNNTWRFRPVGNGEVEVEVLLNMDDGGFLPDFMTSQARRKLLRVILPYTEKLLADPKYQQAKYDFVQEQ